MRQLLIVTAMMVPAVPALGEGPSAATILEKTDEIRSPASAFQMEVEIESVGEPVFRFDVSIGGKDHTIIRTRAPSREIGKNFLMQAEEMWAYLPNIKRAVRVSLNQKLSGQAANGDISRMRWFGDYDAMIESESPDQWVLLLVANKKALTYERVRVWVDKRDYRPARAEYLTGDGKLLKKVTFSDYRQLAGALRPATLTIESATRQGEQSVLRILTMQERQFPTSYFSQGSLQ